MHNIRLILTICVYLVMGSSFFFTSTANAMKDYTVREVQQLLDSSISVFLLNPLSDIEFNQGHIDGSINIPIEQLNETDKLPKDKNTLIVTYCLGPE